uniref:LIM zinc-binding domain-containing protein n=1 Tax=Riptortus pedestris TaxID=329032 RepID=R4WPQ9_RIPPE|nr:conserved hypothetical protein [Riptortus pedestris]
MAEVAKNVVRDDLGGEEEEEEEDRSLGDLIEEELRNLQGKGWQSGDAGWSTVEEVARELVSSPEAKPRAAESPPKVELSNDKSHAVESLLVKSPTVESPLVKSPTVESPLIKSPTDDKSLDPPLAESTPPPSPQARSSPPEPSVEPLEHALVNGDTHQTPESDSELTPQSPDREPQLPLTNGNHTLVVEETSVEYCNDSGQDDLIVNCYQRSVPEEIRSCVEAVLDEVVQEATMTVTRQIQESEHTESTTIVEKKKKKKSIGGSETGEEIVTATKKKTKKSKKSEGKENHISIRRSFGDIHKACENAEPIQTITNNCDKQLKSSFSKFDQLSKKTVLHVRSSDPAKAQKTFSQGSPDGQTAVLCKACQKQVFAMEQIKAERAVWHKNCFRCHTCNKQLTVDIYQSHEGELYCKPHFRELFQPKAVIDNEEDIHVRRRKPEMIIRENQPIELPPEVVRASDKPDLGLEELSSLNVKSRFQVFEKQQQDQADGELERSPTTVSVKRSSSIMSKLAKFQKKGMDIGVTDESLNGFVYEETSSSEEESEEGEEEEDKGVIKCRRKARERPVSFSKMDDVKKNWESVNQSQRREEMREERKLELQQIRSRLFQGKQGKMKELYEQAVAESEHKGGRRESEELASLGDKAKLVRERFEKGEAGAGDGNDNKKAVDEDMAVFEEGISKKSRSIFLEMEAAAKATAPVLPTQNLPARTDSVRRPREAYYKREPSHSEEIVRSSDVVEDVAIETADVSSRFKFFETYREPEKQKRAFRITPPREGQVKSDSPEREVYRDPDVVRCDDKLEDETAIKRSQTASRMLSVFRQLEEQKEVLPDGPKPKKCFTPPPDFKGSESSEEESEGEEEETEEEEEEEESENEDGVVKSSYKIKDEFLEQAKSAARAKQLAAKFEAWEPEKQSTNNAINMLDSEHASIESTKSLKARFESLQNEQPKEKARPKVNRFV